MPFCGVYPDGITSFSMIQAASDAGNADGLVYFVFDLLHLDGEDVSALPLIERKARLATLLSSAEPLLTTVIIAADRGRPSIRRSANWGDGSTDEQ